MNIPHKVLLLSDVFSKAVLATSPIRYYQMNEGSGISLLDSTDNASNGTYANITWINNEPHFDGSSSYGDIYSAALASAFDFEEGCILVKARVSGVGIWTDSTSRRLIQMRRDGDNQIYLMRSTTNNAVSFNYLVGAAFDTYTHTLSTLNDFTMMISWSKIADLIEYLVDGSQVATDTGLVAATGSGLSSSNAVIGAFSTVPANVWDGVIKELVIWDKPADDAMKSLGLPR